MPAEPLSPEEQADVDTLKMLASRVERRGSYCAPFGETLASLNAICARIFNRPPQEPEKLISGAESW
jgi:hypothetical protein